MSVKLHLLVLRNRLFLYAAKNARNVKMIDLTAHNWQK